jgi:hypothetical protein
MGSEITLGINRIEIDYGKNEYFHNHSKLFQKNEKKMEYYYYAQDYKEKKLAFSKRLSKAKVRLELLGYTLKNIKNKYINHCDWYKEYFSRDYFLDFYHFSKIIRSIDLNENKFRYVDGYKYFYNFIEYFEDYIKNMSIFRNFYNTKYFLEEFFRNLDPYIILRLIIENKNNLNKKLIWRYSDIVEGGYVKENELYKDLDITNKYLIITEGTSDLFIVRKNLKLFYPEIFNFFEFIDMDKNYPFTGSGNLFNFVLGLAKIYSKYKILVIFDNDAEGIEKYDQCKKVKLPRDIKITKLPNLKEFNNFDTIGPTGFKKTNINGLAASIECFLDLEYKTDNTPRIRWTNFKNKINRYQGSLENKELYTRLFKKVKTEKEDYNFSKLKILTEHLITECIEMNQIV